MQAFLDDGEDFIVEGKLADLVRRMNALTGEQSRSPKPGCGRRSRPGTREVDNPYSKDAQITAIRGARNYIGDRLVRVVPPHRRLDPTHGPLIAVRLNILTRKSLGGIETDLNARALKADGEPLAGVYAAGEAAGFGGGGTHGYNSLEGTFLGRLHLFGQDRRQGGGGGRLNRLSGRFDQAYRRRPLFELPVRGDLAAEIDRPVGEGVWRLGKRRSPRLVSLYSTRGGTVG